MYRTLRINSFFVMADSNLTKAMAGMNIGGDKPEKETNGESSGLKQPVNGKDELDLSDKTYGYI